MTVSRQSNTEPQGTLGELQDEASALVVAFVDRWRGNGWSDGTIRDSLDAAANERLPEAGFA